MLRTQTKLHNANDARGGFTAVELMIVVTVIGIVASFALPQFATSRKRGNECSAISSLRAVASAQSLYRQRTGAYGSIADLRGQNFLDDNFTDGIKSGYEFVSVGAVDGAIWSVTAEPTTPGTSGDRWFFIDQSGVIRFEDGVAADTSSSALD